MAKISNKLRASKSASTLLVLFIPSVDRDSVPIDQETWVDKTLTFLGDSFGGATAFPRARGVWRDDEKNGLLVFDEPVVIQCYTSLELIDQHVTEFREFLVSMGQATGQGAVGFVIDRDYFEIRL